MRLPVCLGFALGAIAWCAAIGAPPESLQLVLLALAGLTVGLPHGAVDHHVADRLGVRGLAFYGPYLAIAAGVGLAWWGFPALSFGGFLLLSAWHFGEGDLRHLALERLDTAVRWTRGLLVVGTLFLAQPSAVADLLGPGLAATVPSVDPVWAILWLLGAHAVVLAVALESQPRAFEAALLDAAVVTAWLAVAPPLLAFAGYFGVWHSLAHIRTLRLEAVGRPLWWSALPLTVAAAVGGGAGLAAVHLADPTAPVAAVVLPVVAALATPHVVWVERWRQAHPQRLVQAPVSAPRQPVPCGSASGPGS